MVERRREGAAPGTGGEKKPRMVFQVGRYYVTLMKKGGGGVTMATVEDWERMKSQDGLDVFAPVSCTECKGVITKKYLGMAPGARLRFSEECDHVRAALSEGGST